MHIPDWSLEKGLLAAIVKTELIKSPFFSKHKEKYLCAMDLVNLLHSMEVIGREDIFDLWRSLDTPDL
jgi:hypothetical protein